MQTVKCPFCFVFLDVSHLPAGHVLECPGCARPIRVAEPRRLLNRHYILAGLALGLILGVGATLATTSLLRPLPASLTPESPLAPAAAVKPPEPPAGDDTILNVFGRSANEAASSLRQEFGNGTFTMLDSRPWLVALEIGRYKERETMQLYERGLRSLYDSFQKEFASLRLPDPGRALPVVIFNSRESFDIYCRRQHGCSMPATVMGFFEPSRARTVTYHEGFLPIERMLHEGTHQLVHYYSTSPFQSFWFHEGLGSMFETYRKVNEGSFETVVAAPEVNPPRLYEALHAINDPEIKSAVTVSQVMSLSMDSFREWWEQISRDIAREPRRDEAARLEAGRDRLANAYYAVSWAIVYFMLHTDAANSDALKEFFIQETRGRGGRDTFELILKGRSQQDLEQFQEKFLQYLQNLK